MSLQDFLRSDLVGFDYFLADIRRRKTFYEIFLNPTSSRYNTIDHSIFDKEFDDVTDSTWCHVRCIAKKYFTICFFWAIFIFGAENSLIGCQSGVSRTGVSWTGHHRIAGQCLHFSVAFWWIYFAFNHSTNLFNTISHTGRLETHFRHCSRQLILIKYEGSSVLLQHRVVTMHYKSRFWNALKLNDYRCVACWPTQSSNLDGWKISLSM